MGEIRVNLEALESGRAGIGRTFAQLQQTLEDLETGLKPMIESWSGAAQDQYLLCKRQWDAAAQALAEVLGTITTSVGAAHENYSATHDATVRIWA